MDRYLVISSDGHAGLPPERYRDYVDPQYREEFDRQLAAAIAERAAAENAFLISEFNTKWRPITPTASTAPGIRRPATG